MSATPDSTLADPQQIIAGLQRQLAECRAERDEALAERDEALEQQIATAEVLQVINSSPGDLSPVFDAMLQRAVRLCGASHGVLRTYDGQDFPFAAASGEPSALGRLQQFGAVRPTPGGSFAAIVAGEPVVHVADVRDTEQYQTNPNARQRSDLMRVRTWLAVALRREDTLLGMIALYRQEVRPFSEKEIALVQNFAAQAVIAMENARLLTETREALEQQTATAEVLQVINSSPGNLTPVFDAILDKAHTLCGAEFGSLFLYDGQHFRAIASHGVPEPLVSKLREGIGANDSRASQQLMVGAPFAHIHDSALEEHAVYRGMDMVSSHRTLLSVPLRKGDALLGMIVAGRLEVQPFTDKQIALLQNFAAQAVIAMENARLLTETREALEQQTATAEVLQVINSSPGDLTPVFDAILEKAHALCGATRGALATYDGEWFRAITTRGMPESFAEHMRRGFPLKPGPLGHQLLRGEHVHIVDLPAAAADSPPELARLQRQAVELAGARTLLMAPLCKDGRFLGYIAGYRTEVRAFTEKQIALLENFAAQAVIAMENARLITETREGLEQQTATAEVLQVINSSPGDLTPVFDAMLERAMQLCGASFGTLRTRDGERFDSVASRGVPPAFDEFLANNPQRARPRTIGARILNGEPLVHIVDVADDELYRSGDPQRRALVELGAARTTLVVPLTKDGAVLGTIQLYRQHVQPFTDKQIALLQNFAAQAVIAIENARLLGELRQRTEEVAELNRGLEARVAAQLDELGRVGRLKRFLAPQLAELIVSQGDEKILESHRREIVVVFCDLRGYTAFTETAEPEEVLDFLREYHGALGPLVAQFEGTLDQFSGDGIMVFFNDPVPCPDPAERAVNMAVAMRETARTLIAAWRRRGRALGFGAGIAQGYATLGQIGFADRSGYTAIGTVCNLAARLCAEAKDGQILIAQRVAIAIEETTPLEELGELTLKGLTQPVVVFNVPLVGGQAAFRVIEGGAPSA